MFSRKRSSFSSIARAAASPRSFGGTTVTDVRGAAVDWPPRVVVERPSERIDRWVGERAPRERAFGEEPPGIGEGAPSGEGGGSSIG